MQVRSFDYDNFLPFFLFGNFLINFYLFKRIYIYIYTCVLLTRIMIKNSSSCYCFCFSFSDRCISLYMLLCLHVCICN